jgi:hypothetical protein
MDLTPLFCVVRVTEKPLVLLTRELLLVVSVVTAVSTILAISSVSHVDFPVILLLLRGPLVTRLKKSSPGFKSLNIYVSDCEQTSHRFGLLHDDILYSLDVTDFIVEDVDDLDILDIQDSVPSIAEIFHVVSEALILLLLDGLQSLSNIWMLIRVLEVPDEHDT